VDYDAYGNPISANGGAVVAGGLSTLVGSDTDSATKFGFGGGYLDASALIYLINRYYDSATGQFISVDPELSSTGTPYAYAGDNPANSTDFLGLRGWTFHDGAWHWYKGNKWTAAPLALWVSIAWGIAAVRQGGSIGGLGKEVLAGDVRSDIVDWPIASLRIGNWTDPNQPPAEGFVKDPNIPNGNYYNSTLRASINFDLEHAGNAAPHLDLSIKSNSQYGKAGSYRLYQPSDGSGVGIAQNKKLEGGGRPFSEETLSSYQGVENAEEISSADGDGAGTGDGEGLDGGGTESGPVW
jgi:RHS repeat-associated protein